MRLVRSTSVAFLQSEQHLHEYFPDDILCNKVLVHFAFLDQLCHVAVLTVLHDDVEFALIFHDQFFVVADDIRVV